VVANNSSNDSSALVEYRVKIVSTSLDLTGIEEFSIEISAPKLLGDSSISKSSSLFTIQTIANRPIETYSSISPICNPASAIFATINNVTANGFKVKLDKQLLATLNEGYFTLWIKYDEQQLKHLKINAKSASTIILSHLTMSDVDSAIRFETATNSTALNQLLSK